MTIHPLQGDGFLMEINDSWIQAIYTERDEALARNRELEARYRNLQTWFDDMCATLTSLADQLIARDKEHDELLSKVQILEEEKAGLEFCYEVERKAHADCISERMTFEAVVQQVEAENKQLKLLLQEVIELGKEGQG